jgi:rSAM/selenodomain-associated transferase 2
VSSPATGSVSLQSVARKRATEATERWHTGIVAPIGSPAGLISIIVPVFNEAALIRRCLTNLRKHAPSAEVIVADGGSTDGTLELATELCDQLITSVCQRAVQMNAGASIAHGDAFWFIHVDVEIPPGCLQEITRKLDDPTVAGGYFRIRLPRDRFIYRLVDNVAHYTGWLLRIRCGDHGLFCRRTAFQKLGGFPDVPLMEDVDFFRALHHCGRVCVIDNRLLPSVRRYQAIGPTRLTVAYGLIAGLYAFGLSRRVLCSLYDRLCNRHQN